MIIVMNKRYAPLASKPADTAGVTSYVRALIAHNKMLGIESEMILFDRHNDSDEFEVAKAKNYECASVILPFSLNEEELRIANRFDEALRYTNSEYKNIYLQSGVYAPYVTCHFATFTHHGPFVENVERALGVEGAIRAFGGGFEKVLALRRMQERGLEVLSENPKHFALEMSPLQVSTLLAAGVCSDRVGKVLPAAPALPESERLTERVESWINDSAKIKFFTACARHDEFKNIDEIIKACSILESIKADYSCLIVSGTQSDNNKIRQTSRILGINDERMHLSPSIRPGQLRSLFVKSAGRAPFIFCSKYETLGMTSLQAGDNGCFVLCANRLDSVGAAGVLNSSYLYEAGASGLASSILSYFSDSALKNGSPSRCGNSQFFEDVYRSVSRWPGNAGFR